jgi:hypothetical protein
MSVVAIASAKALWGAIYARLSLKVDQLALHKPQNQHNKIIENAICGLPKIKG